MNKIPMGKTIAAAYHFTFMRLERVIAVIWLPMIVLTVADYFTSGPYLTGMANALDSGDMTQMGPLLATRFAVGLFELLMGAVIAVAITREVIAPLERPLFLRFSLGSAEFRVVGAVIGLYLMLFLILLVCMIIGIASGGSLTAALPAAKFAAAGQRAMVAGLLIALLFSPLLIYAFTRLAYFVVPAASVEGGFGLARSWQLAKGNVLRIIAIALAVGLPPALVFVALQGVVLGPDAVSPHLDLGGGATQVRQSAEQLRQMAAHLPLLKGLEFVLAPFVYGLAFSAPAFAYKALTEAAKQ